MDLVGAGPLDTNVLAVDRHLHARVVDNDFQGPLGRKMRISVAASWVTPSVPSNSSIVAATIARRAVKRATPVRRVHRRGRSLPQNFRHIYRRLIAIAGTVRQELVSDD